MQENDCNRPLRYKSLSLAGLLVGVAVLGLLVRTKTSDSDGRPNSPTSPGEVRITAAPLEPASVEVVPSASLLAPRAHNLDAEDEDLDPVDAHDPVEVGPSDTQLADAKAREYYDRDLDGLRRTFLGGQTSPLTGAQLSSQYEFSESTDVDALALVVDAETVQLQESLERLADEYMDLLDRAFRSALITNSVDVEAGVGLKNIARKHENEMYRILVESGGDTHVYRIRTEDPGRLARLYEARDGLLANRKRATIRTLIAITGQTPKSKNIVNPFKKQ